MSTQVIEFTQAAAKHKAEREHERKEAKVEAMQARFKLALPEKKTPVKDYLQKKKAKKHRG